MLPTLVFFLVLAVHDLLWFYENFRIFSFYFLIEIVLSSTDILEVFILFKSMNMAIIPIICLLFILSVFNSVQYIGVSPLCLNSSSNTLFVYLFHNKWNYFLDFLERLAENMAEFFLLKFNYIEFISQLF